MSSRTSTMHGGFSSPTASGPQMPIVRPEGVPGDGFLHAVQEILQSRQLTNGSRVQEFERAAAEYLGVAHCVAVSSCTAGLVLTLSALGLKGEVIVPSFTFYATAHSILWNGLRPVFADCDAQSFCIDPQSAADRLSPYTACVLAVHMFGCPAPVQALAEICERNRIPLVYDAAHAFGSKIGSTHVGKFGAAEVFSFSPTKLVVAGEGGLIATSDAALASRLRAARNYGDAGDSDPKLLGLNARMSELHAALAVAGLTGLDARIARRNEIRLQYRRSLADLPGLSFQEIDIKNRSTCKDMPIIVDELAFGASRDSVHAFLAEQHIETRRYFWPPVHQQKLYREMWDRKPLPVTERISDGVLSLPIYSSLTDSDVVRVCDMLHRAFETAQRSRRAKPNATVQVNVPRDLPPVSRSQRREETNAFRPDLT